MEILILISIIYSVGFIIFLFGNAFVTGYTGNVAYTLNALWSSIIWPLSLIILIGLGTRIIKERLKLKKLEKGTQNEH